MKKTYIVDTNVTLHSPEILHELIKDKNNKIIFTLPVIEELDTFKTGTTMTSYNARKFMRFLEEPNSRFTIDINKYALPSDIQLEAKKVDNLLLACALNYKKKDNNVTLLTNDINLRIKARALKINISDYKQSRIINIKYKGLVELGMDEKNLAELYDKKSIPGGKFKTLITNQYLLLRDNTNPKHTALGRFTSNKRIELVKQIKAFGISPKNLEQTLALDALLNRDIPMVALTGLAGTGKTLLALAAALETRQDYKQIYITRQTVPVGEDLGFLPGTAIEKISPYLESFYDNLKIIKSARPTNKSKIDEMQKLSKIEIAPITFLRGRTIPDIYFIIDEAQNLTQSEIKTIITRAGKGTKIVLLGDTDQIDVNHLNSYNNGLSYVIDKFKGNRLFAYLHMKKGERSALASAASVLL